MDTIDVEIKIKKVMDHLEIYVNNDFVQSCDFWERDEVVKTIKEKLYEENKKDFDKCLLFHTIVI